MNEREERILVVKQRGIYYKTQTVWSNEQLERDDIFEVISEHKTVKDALTEAKRLTELNK
jgi:hypothetical protein